MDPEDRRDRRADHHPPDDPQLGGLIRRAYGVSVDVDTAARHLWVLHRRSATSRGQRLRHAVVTVLAALMVVSTSSVAVAMSGSALPGEALYHVKRGTERVHLLVSRAPETDARLYLQFARARLNEAVAVAPARPTVLPKLFDDAATSVEHAERVGGDEFADEVVAIRVEASAAITTLAPTVETEVALALDEIARRLADVAVVLEAPAIDAAAPDASGGQPSGGEPDRTAASAAPDVRPARPPASEERDESADDGEDEIADDGEEQEEEEAAAREVVVGESGEEQGATGPREAEPTTEPDSESKLMPGVRELGGMLADRSGPGEQPESSVGDDRGQRSTSDPGGGDSPGREGDHGDTTGPAEDDTTDA